MDATCQTCKYRKKCARHSICAVKGGKVVGCLDQACDKYEWRNFCEEWEDEVDGTK